MNTPNYPDPMTATQQRNWRKVRHGAFVWIAAAAFVLLFEWSGWNPISLLAGRNSIVGLVAALAILAVLFGFRQRKINRRRLAAVGVSSG